MGSGSSKAKNIAVQKTRILSLQEEPVANVNKPEHSTPTTTLNQIESSHKVVNTLVKNNTNKTDTIFPVDETNKSDKKKDISRNIVKGKLDVENPSELLFQDYSDLEEDIDQVLKIPLAVDNSKQNGNKEKTETLKRKKDKSGYEKVQESKINVIKESTDVDAPLPETYVQRLRRQQYKLQQNVLLRDKEIVRNPEEWQQENDHVMHASSHQTGFDATKFRAANRGRDLKKDLFTTEPEDVKTPHYFQSLQPDFDDFEWKSKEDDPVTQKLPHYDQSELDLMKQLEDEIL